MRLKRLNSDGVAEFRSLLEKDRAGATPDFVGLWNSSKCTELAILPNGAEIAVVERLEVTQRRAVGEYLVRILADIQDVEQDVGLWSWLSLAWIDQLRPKKGAGIGSDYRYIPSEDYRNYYRNLLLTPYRVCSAYRKPDSTSGLDDAMVLLANDVSSPGDLNEQLASRQELWSNREILAAATALYYDKTKGAVKPGAGSTRPGSVRRFAEAFVDQFAVNWDLTSMDRNQILDFLPQEFGRFR